MERKFQMEPLANRNSNEELITLSERFKKDGLETKDALDLAQLFIIKEKDALGKGEQARYEELTEKLAKLRKN